MKLDKAYQPGRYETDIYKLWESAGAFTPSDDGEPFCILMPPPNANDDLHLGHTLTTAIEDILIRYARMNGKAALFLPGADHAGFETQVVFERKLEEQGKSRFDYPRDKLYRMIWDYVQDNKSKMENQQRRIGASCDWSRNTFTLDDHVIERTYETFRQLHRDGLLYRGPRIVNFCTRHGTSFSELEVEYRPARGKLYFINYPLEGSKEQITVATTRPETMLGDTAVAVHPADKRYRHLTGKLIRLPLCNRLIPVVGDEAVDSAFGTGAVKVTPAHDALDFEIGERHNLPQISLIGRDGKLTGEAPEAYRGLSVAEARKRVIDDLKKQGYLGKTEAYSHSVGHCYKCGTVIEPLVIDQWLIRMKPLAKAAIAALEKGEIKVVPARMERVLFSWLENIKDWNISRQIVWGIPIPAFISGDGSVIIDWKSQDKTIKRGGKTYHRDPDTFDTWFSSGQWPVATLRYPDHPDFKQFYPTSVMETAGEIIFFWVARMIMLGLYVTGEVPFKSVYLHGLVLDEHGKKMSKSRGNVLSPVPLLERYGADALRMGIIANRSAGQNQGFSEKRVEGYRNFVNKLWNVARFVIDKTEAAKPSRLKNEAPAARSLAERWMLSRLESSSKTITANVEGYRFGEALEALYRLVWDDFADWYIEASKAEPNPELLDFCLRRILRLAHPFAPFVTEAIWQRLPGEDTLLITSSWPQPGTGVDTRAVGEFGLIQDTVKEVRALKAELGMSKIVLRTDSATLLRNQSLIIKLAGLDSIKPGEGNWRLTTKTKAWVQIDPGAAAGYRQKLERRLFEAKAYAEQLKDQLKNRGFRASAPKSVVDGTKERLSQAEALISRLNEQTSALRHL